MSTIAKVKLEYSWPSSVMYNQNFCQEATDNGSKNWLKVEPSTYTQYFTNAAISSQNWCKVCQSIVHGSDIHMSTVRAWWQYWGHQHCMQEALRAAPSSPQEAASCSQPFLDLQVIQLVQQGQQVWRPMYMFSTSVIPETSKITPMVRA